MLDRAKFLGIIDLEETAKKYTKASNVLGNDFRCKYLVMLLLENGSILPSYLNEDEDYMPTAESERADEASMEDYQAAITWLLTKSGTNPMIELRNLEEEIANHDPAPIPMRRETAMYIYLKSKEAELLTAEVNASINNP